MPKDITIAPRLLRWFDQHGRKNLPWQQQINPYRVWVSEIMLQQTQVATVIPYFNRFMETYPTVEALANANQDQVLHLWTGLGYYSRARNLHKSAQVITSQHQGEFPDTLDDLIDLPGIGRSTAGAILAIAFKQPVSILDGNVKRVLARHFAIEGWPGQSIVHKKLWQVADQHTPQQRVADYTQAIMDLGATLCTRTKPNCQHCPLTDTCKGHQQNKPTDYPGKKPKKALPVKKSLFAILLNENNHVLLQRRPPSGIWGGLWAFPEQPLPEEPQDTKHIKDTITALAKQRHCQIQSMQILAQQRHTFSHFHLDYIPVMVQIEQTNAVMDETSHLWYNSTQSVGTPAPVQKLLKQLNIAKAK